jgi:hypothetical protein
MAKNLPDSVRHAAGVWAYRARAEAQASGRFAQIARDLKTTGAPEALVSLAKEAQGEESHHVELCLGMVKELGGTIPRPEIPHVPSGLPGLNLGQSLLLQVVGMCCINETVSAAVLGEMLKNATHPLAHRTIQTILKDEVGHARLGWGYLAWSAQKEDVSGLEPLLPGLLQNAVEDELFESSMLVDPAESALGLGAVPRASRWALFQAAMEDLVFPGFEQLGVSTRAAKDWLAHR